MINHHVPLQIAMMTFSSLPGTKPVSECNSKEVLVARETYEYACLLSVALSAALPEADRSDDQGESHSNSSAQNGRFTDTNGSCQALHDTWRSSKHAIQIIFRFFRPRNSSFSCKGLT